MTNVTQLFNLHKMICSALVIMFSTRSVWEQFEDSWEVSSVTALALSAFLNNEENCTQEHKGIILSTAKTFIRRMATIKLTEILSDTQHLTLTLREE